MESVTRRELLQAGAQPSRLGGIHIHGSLQQTAGPGGSFGRIVDLNGFGWDANPQSAGSHEPAAPDRTQCFWTQRGSVDGDTVKLRGRNLFWQNPGDDGAPVIVDANLATGRNPVGDQAGGRHLRLRRNGGGGSNLSGREEKR